MMSTCSREAALFYPYRSVLSRLELTPPIWREKYLKIDWSLQMPLHWLIMGDAGSW